MQRDCAIKRALISNMSKMGQTAQEMLRCQALCFEFIRQLQFVHTITANYFWEFIIFGDLQMESDTTVSSSMTTTNPNCTVK